MVIQGLVQHGHTHDYFKTKKTRKIIAEPLKWELLHSWPGTRVKDPWKPMTPPPPSRARARCWWPFTASFQETSGPETMALIPSFLVLFFPLSSHPSRLGPRDAASRGQRSHARSSPSKADPGNLVLDLRAGGARGSREQPVLSVNAWGHGELPGSRSS